MRHPLHSICPYFAMFPEDFVAKQVLAYTERGDLVFDPFCGRGTTVFESLLNGRLAAGVDINPVAACIAGAKADPPTLTGVLRRLDQLERECVNWEPDELRLGEFFRACFHPRTLREILFLRHRLNWAGSKVDRFIAAVTLGCLHGESHKSPNYLSNRMPRTISTKPDYSIRWWSERDLTAPERPTFDILRRMCAFRLSQPVARCRGEVKLGDVRRAASTFPSLQERVKLVVTSPPYLDTTDYSEDQWLRLWFLGGPAHPQKRRNVDDRLTNVNLYWQFLSEAWAGCSRLLLRGTIIVIRIGGTRLEKEVLRSGLRASLEKGFGHFVVTPLHAGDTTEIKNRQTNAFRPGLTQIRYEHDFAFQLS